MTQRKQIKRRFSPEFKLEAIEQVIKYQQRAVDVAQSEMEKEILKQAAVLMSEIPVKSVR